MTSCIQSINMPLFTYLFTAFFPPKVYINNRYMHAYIHTYIDITFEVVEWMEKCSEGKGVQSIAIELFNKRKHVVQRIMISLVLTVIVLS